MNKVNIQDIENAYSVLKNNYKKPYKSQEISDNSAYKEFIKYFSGLSTITEHNMIIGAHFTYGWMPTIITLKLNKSNQQKALQILNNAKDGNKLSEHDYDFLKVIINNSLVGTSKLLHFIRPDKYPIWDSRVYWFINKEEAYDYRIGNTNNYLEYIDICSEITSNKLFEPIHANINNRMGYDVTAFRAIEFIMYNFAIEQMVSR